MSASSPMGRTAILMVALAAGLTAFASEPVSGAPARPATAHRKTAETRERQEALRARHARTRHSARVERSARSVRRRPAARAASYRIARQARPSAHSRIAEERAIGLRHRRAIARDEAGQAAGLRILRERLARETVARLERESAWAEHRRQGDRQGDSSSLLRPAAEVRFAAPAPVPRTEPRESPSQSSAAASIARPGAAPVATLDSATELNAVEAAEPREDGPREDDPRPFADPASLAFVRGSMPAPLRGSLALLERQDERLEADGLEPIENEADLSVRIAHHLLVPIPVSNALIVNAQLPLHHRYCRPWTARFLVDLARAHEAIFHRPIEVNSAVRTVAYQEHLVRINGNAAPAVGGIFSPHEMGATIDIAKKPMSREEIAWMRRCLLALELAGKIDVEEEFEQSCFHITVYRNYLPARTPRPSQSKGPRVQETKGSSERAAEGLGF